MSLDWPVKFEKPQREYIFWHCWIRYMIQKVTQWFTTNSTSARKAFVKNVLKTFQCMTLIYFYILYITFNLYISVSNFSSTKSSLRQHWKDCGAVFFIMPYPIISKILANKNWWYTPYFTLVWLKWKES